tara:strand:- start:1038 stop:1250 length:213 start_codon:yes stop_codon:yes gene_type:complete
MQKQKDSNHGDGGAAQAREFADQTNDELLKRAEAELAEAKAEEAREREAREERRARNRRRVSTCCGISYR